MTLIHIYLWQQQAIVPTVVKTEAGFYLDSAPVELIPLTAPSRLSVVLEERAAKGNVKVPTPSREELKKALVVRFAKARNWNAFEKSTDCCMLEVSTEIITARITERGENGRWKQLGEQRRDFAPGTDLATVLKEMLRSQAPMV